MVWMYNSTECRYLTVTSLGSTTQAKNAYHDVLRREVVSCGHVLHSKNGHPYAETVSSRNSTASSRRDCTSKIELYV